MVNATRWLRVAANQPWVFTDVKTQNEATSPIVLAGIVRKRAAVASEIEALRTRVANLQANLTHSTP